MSTDAEKLAEIRARAEKAHQMVVSLCKPRNTEGHRDWLMSIPAQPNYDPDLVIGASLRDIPYLLDLAATQAQRIAELELRWQLTSTTAKLAMEQMESRVTALREALERESESLDYIQGNMRPTNSLATREMVLGVCKRLRAILESTKGED